MNNEDDGNMLCYGSLNIGIIEKKNKWKCNRINERKYKKILNDLYFDFHFTWLLCVPLCFSLD